MNRLAVGSCELGHCRLENSVGKSRSDRGILITNDFDWEGDMVQLADGDIAWFIYANRPLLAGCPIARLHPLFGDWYATLFERPEFSKEIQLPPPLKERFDATRSEHGQAGKSLEHVAGF